MKYRHQGKVWCPTIQKFKQEQPKSKITELCSVFGYSKQAFYKQCKNSRKQILAENIIVGLVKEKRKVWKKGSGRNLHQSLKAEFFEQGIKIGRDKFYEILRSNNMINQRRNYRTYTTNSFHHYHKYPNIIRDVLPFKPNGIWVSDITYIWLTDEQKFCYLFLITDMYSRKIVGYSLREDLSRTGAVISLKMALSQVKDKEELSSCIHHSDRGVQYCCKEYVKILNKYKISISMTENSDPLENAIAERINKTIKEEFTDKKTLSYPTFKEAKIKIIEIVNFYNFERPHRSIEYLVPCKAHEITGELKRMWKSYYRKSNVGVYEA